MLAGVVMGEKMSCSENIYTNFIKSLFLHLLAVLFTIFNITNVKFLPTIPLFPMLDLMIIYYFAIYRQGIFSLWFLFLLGIWSDALNGLPLGASSLIYVLTVTSFNIINQRLAIKENFLQIWQQFIAFAIVILLLKWFLLSIYHLKFYNLTSPLISLIISIILYVIIHRFFDFLSKKLNLDKI